MDQKQALMIVSKNGMALKSIENQTKEICVTAVRENGLALQYIKDKTPAICLAAVKSNPMALRYIDDQTDKLCSIAVSSDGNAIKYVKNKTKELCLKAVKESPGSLQYIENQTEEMCLAAVKGNGMALQFVKNQTDAICMAAIRYDTSAFKFVKNQTKSICIEAVSANPQNLKLITNQTNEICAAALAADPLALKYIKERSVEVIASALISSPHLLDELIFKDEDEVIGVFKNKKIDKGLIRYLDNTFKTKRVFMEILKSSKNIDVLHYIPSSIIDSELANLMISIDDEAINILPSDFMSNQDNIKGLLAINPKILEGAERFDLFYAANESDDIGKIIIDNITTYDQLLSFIDKLPPKSLLDYAIEKIPETILFLGDDSLIDRATVEKILDTGKLSGYVINEHINTLFDENEKPALYKRLIENNGLALQHIPSKFATDENLRIAVAQNGLAIKFIKNPSPDLCEIAFKNNKQSITMMSRRYSFISDDDIKDFLLSSYNNINKIQNILTPLTKEISYWLLFDPNGLKVLNDITPNTYHQKISKMIVAAINNLQDADLIKFFNSRSSEDIIAKMPKGEEFKNLLSKVKMLEIASASKSDKQEVINKKKII